MSNIWFLGVDPGQSGGMALIGPNQKLGQPGVAKVILKEMPGTEEDIWSWFYQEVHTPSFRSIRREVIGYIEHVHAMPKQGVSSMFKFGMSYGSLRMAMTAAGVNVNLVRPEEWQKALGIPTKKKHTEFRDVPLKSGKNKGQMKSKGFGGEDPSDFKDRLIEFAKMNFLSVQGINAKTADALLIAEYARRIYKSTPSQ